MRLKALPFSAAPPHPNPSPWRAVWPRFIFNSRRFWIYQRERFPILSHGLLIAAFSFSAVSYSFLLRGGHGVPAGLSIAVAFLSSFLLFFQLRVADEFKDFEDDARWRPYRPVPRGLVSLTELGWMGGAAAVLQLALAAWISWRLGVLLVLVWIYLGLMTREFFVRDWIVRRPVTYLWTHMLIIPMADFYAPACDWTRGGGGPPRGLFWFLLLSFCNGIALEIGRKIRSPDDEEPGVRTYSVLWGRGRATVAWLVSLAATGACAVAAAGKIDFTWPVVAILFPVLTLAAIFAGRFLREPTTRSAKSIEALSGVWTLCVYFGLGVVPLLVRLSQAIE